MKIFINITLKLAAITAIAFSLLSCGDENPPTQTERTYKVVLENSNSADLAGLWITFPDNASVLRSADIERLLPLDGYAVFRDGLNEEKGEWTFVILTKRCTLRSCDLMEIKTEDVLTGQFTIIDACDSDGIPYDNLGDFTVRMVEE